MRTLHALNVNEAYTVGLRMLLESGDVRPSRAGECLTYPDPVSTVYLHSDQRVLFDEKRNANPFFHFMEGLWMLAGRNDVKWIERYNSKFGQFSDDGKKFWGAYGHRWRHWFDYDQIDVIIGILKRDPNSRRCVLAMWDGNSDLLANKIDTPCNTTIFFRIRHRDMRHEQRIELDMTVCCRSNDIIWGAYGANAVHMSMLHEYVASMVGVPLGTYTQISNDYHAYTAILATVGTPQPAPRNPYDIGQCKPYPMVHNPESWYRDLLEWMTGSVGWSADNPFFFEVATPMRLAWNQVKEKNLGGALSMAADIRATDWRLACEEWIKRRAKNAADKQHRRPKV